MAIKLHEHQIEAVEAIENQFNRGKRRTLAVLATGAGKTIIYLHLVNKWAEAGSRILILAHRRELIHQPVERARQFWPELAKKMGVVMANLDESDAQVVVATVQTVSRDRLENQKFDYVILDEAHHGTASTYMKLVEKFPNARWLGLTATPFRTDGDSLAKVFDSVAYRFSISTAIESGILVPFDAYGFTLPLSLDGLVETEDGWEEEKLGSLLSAENCIEVVYQKWFEYCTDRKTICFTSSVGQAYATAKYFKSHGIAAAAVDGTTPKKLRDNILKEFQTGNLQVVANCQVWTEGVDVPEAGAALMVCPTKSDLAYVQKLGRILRTFKDKKDAVVLDFAPMEDRNIVMAGDILGIPRLVEKEKSKAQKSGVLVGASRIDRLGLAVSVDPTEVMVQALKYLRKGSYAWALQDYLAVATLSAECMLAIEIPNLDRILVAEGLKKAGKWDQGKENLLQSLCQHRLWICLKNEFVWNSTYISSYESMEKAIAAGETVAEKYSVRGLAKKSGQWRRRIVTDAQKGYMKRLRVEVPDGCTSGQAAQLISHKLASNSVLRIRPTVEQKIMKGGA